MGLEFDEKIGQNTYNACFFDLIVLFFAPPYTSNFLEFLHFLILQSSSNFWLFKRRIYDLCWPWWTFLFVPIFFNEGSSISTVTVKVPNKSVLSLVEPKSFELWTKVKAQWTGKTHNKARVILFNYFLHQPIIWKQLWNSTLHLR